MYRYSRSRDLLEVSKNLLVRLTPSKVSHDNRKYYRFDFYSPKDATTDDEWTNLKDRLFQKRPTEEELEQDPSLFEEEEQLQTDIWFHWGSVEIPFEIVKLIKNKKADDDDLKPDQWVYYKVVPLEDTDPLYLEIMNKIKNDYLDKINEWKKDVPVVQIETLTTGYIIVLVSIYLQLYKIKESFRLLRAIQQKDKNIFERIQDKLRFSDPHLKNAMTLFRRIKLNVAAVQDAVKKYNLDPEVQIYVTQMANEIRHFTTHRRRLC